MKGSRLRRRPSLTLFVVDFISISSVFRRLRRRRTRSFRMERRIATSAWWTGCSPRLITASAGRGAGWISRVTRTRTATKRTATRSIWPWRDWVIKALNADMPFDQFTIEQIAGDLLPNATREQIVATGFHRNTMLNEEGGIDPLEFRFHAMTDRVATTGATWLGLTIGCAQCHTHKFDPIQHREYYQFMAFLNNADEPDLDLTATDDGAQQRARNKQAAKLIAELSDKWPVEAEVARWETLRPVEVKTGTGEIPRVLNDGSVLFAAPGPDSDACTFTFDLDATGIDRVRLEALTDDSLPNKGPGRVPHGNFVLSEIVITAAPRTAPEKVVPVPIASATADAEQEKFPVDRGLRWRYENRMGGACAGKNVECGKDSGVHVERRDRIFRGDADRRAARTTTREHSHDRPPASELRQGDARREARIRAAARNCGKEIRRMAGTGTNEDRLVDYAATRRGEVEPAAAHGAGRWLGLRVG